LSHKLTPDSCALILNTINARTAAFQKFVTWAEKEKKILHISQLGPLYRSSALVL